MANRYWRGGAGTWNTISTTNWSDTSGGAGGFSVPTASDNVFFDQAATYSVTMTGALACLSITVSAGTVSFLTGTTPTLQVNGSMSLIAMTWTSTGAITFNATTTGQTITTGGTTINGAITFDGIGGGWSLGSALTTGVTLTTTLTNGALTLNNFNLTTGIFSSSNTNTRSIAFGSGNIILSHTTALQTVLSMATATGFTYTTSGTFGSGTGCFQSTMSTTRTFVFGTTGGTNTTAPTLYLASGASIATITTGSWFNEINFGTTGFTIVATSLNLNSLYSLSSTSNLAALTSTMVGTGSLRTNTTMGTLIINSTGGTTSLITGGTTTTCTTCTLTSGTLNINSQTLTCSSTFTFVGGSLNNIGALNCTTFTLNGATLNFTSGTISPSTSFVVTSGSFTYNGGSLATVPTFTQNGGTVQFNFSYNQGLSEVGTGYNFTFNAGTLSINDGITVTTNTFTSTSGSTRILNFGLSASAGYITLNVYSEFVSAITRLNMANSTGLTINAISASNGSLTGVPGGFRVIDQFGNDQSSTFTSGTTGGNAANSPSIYFQQFYGTPTFTTGSWFNELVLAALGGNGGSVPATSINCNSLYFDHVLVAITNVSVNFTGLTGGNYYFRSGGAFAGEGNLVAVTINSLGTLNFNTGLNCASCTFTAGTTNFASFNLACSGAASFTAGTLSNVGTISCTTFTVNGTLAHSSGTITPSVSFVTTSGSYTQSGTSVLSAVPTFTQTAGNVTFRSTYALTATGTYTLTAGTLTLGDNLTTGIFSSSGTVARSIAFSTFNIILAHTTAATTVLSMADLTNFTWSGTGGFTTAMSVTRTLTCGSTAGGSITTAPNLSIQSGASIPTFTTGSWFNNLNFTGSTATPAISTVNFTSTLTLAAGGTYTNLSITAAGTGTITNNAKPIAGFAVNNGAGTVTLSAALSCTTYTQTSGTLDFATFNLSCSSTATLTTGTLTNAGTITCTTATVNGAFTLTNGTITPSAGFVVTTGGAFTYSGGTINTTNFTHTAGTVTNTVPWTLTTNATYTLTAGTLTLGEELTIGIFSSSGTGVRAIAFSTYNITLNHSTAAQTVLNVVNGTNFTWTGTGGFLTDASVTRTIAVGSTSSGTLLGFNVTYTGSGNQTQTLTNSDFNNLDFGTTTCSVATGQITVAGLILSSSGSYTGVTVRLGDQHDGATTRNITTNGKIIFNLTNIGTSSTPTLTGPVTTGTYVQTSGNLDFATYDITCSSTATLTTGALTNVGTISCTTATVNGAFTLTNGTITPSVSFVVTAGTFTYTGGTLSPVSTFTHTAGNVTLNQSLALSSTGTYTLTAGTLTLNNNTLTTNAFISTGTGTRSVAFGTTGQITLTGNNTTIWDGGSTGFTITGTMTVVSTYAGNSGTRTINVGTGWTTSTGFDVKVNSAVGISIGTGASDTVVVAGNMANFDLTDIIFTFTPGVMTVYGNYTIPITGGTISSSTNTTTFAGTSSQTITVSRTIDFPLNFSGLGGTFNLGANLTTGTTRTTNLGAGTLTLNGYDLTTGLFTSTVGTFARTIAFGTNSINVSGSGTVWDTSTVTNLTTTGTQVVNVTNATATATTVLPGSLDETNCISFNFTAGTYTLTLFNLSYSVRDLDFTGFSGTWANFTSSPAIYGNFTLSTGITMPVTVVAMGFQATSGVKTITTYSKSMPAVNFNGVGGSWILGSDYTSAGTVGFNAGTFDTGGYAFTVSRIDSNSPTNPRTINLNNSTITLTGTGIVLNSTNLTLNEGVSQINLTSASSTGITATGGATFYNVAFTGGGTVALTTIATYNNLSFTNGPTTPSVVTITATQTVNGTLSTVSTSAITRTKLQSTAPTTTQVTIIASAVSLTDTDFQGIYASGASIPWTGTRLSNLGNNTNITFDAGTDKYWSLAAGGNWNAVAWATTSGGTPDVNNFPLAQDTAIIENTGLNTSATITVNASWNIGTLSMSTRTNAMTFAIGATNPLIYGSWTNGTGTTVTGTGTVNFVGAGTTQTLTSAGSTFAPNITVSSIAGTLQLGSALTLGATSTFTLIIGTLSLNGYNLTTGVFSSNNSSERSILFGSNNIVLAHTTAGVTVLDMANTTNFLYTGTGGFTSGMSVTRTFTSGTTAAVLGSILFNGTSQYLTSTNASGWLAYTGDHTVEAWVYITAYSTTGTGNSTIASQNNGISNNNWDFGITSLGYLYVNYIGSSNIFIQGTTQVTTSAWHHVTFTRSSNTTTLYLDGVSVGSGSVTGFSSTAQPNLNIGYFNSGFKQYFTGYISNFRMVNSLAVYTGAFTPSRAPLAATQNANTNVSAISGTQTKILLNTRNNASYLGDTSINNNTVTNVNAATASSLTPMTITPAAGTPANLSLTSGAAIPTFTTGSYFDTLDFTGSTCTPATATVNLSNNLVLASGGTYTALTVSIYGASLNTVTGNSKTIPALTLLGGTNTISGTLTATAFTINGPNFNFTSGTLNSTTFTLTSGSFTIGGTAVLGAVTNFIQTLGDVTFGGAYSLAATGAYTLTSGTLTLGGTLTTGTFSSSSSRIRTIAFGIYNIVLATTTAGATNLNLTNLTNLTYTGTGQFTTAMSVTRTFVSGLSTSSTGSVLLNGTTQYLTITTATGDALDLATGSPDWTIETWFYLTSVASNRQVFCKGGVTGSQNPTYSFVVLTGGGGQWVIAGPGGSIYNIQSFPSSTFVISTWYHFALVRNGNTMTAYINGVPQTPVAVTITMVNTGTLLGIGNAVDGSSSPFAGYITNFRITKGVAVYTGNFAAYLPTSPLTVSQNAGPAGSNIAAISLSETSLLLNMPNNTAFLVDNSIYAWTVINVASVPTNALSPFAALGPSTWTTYSPPNILLTSGAAAATFTANSLFDNIDFTGTTSTVTGGVLINTNLTFATGGTYTGLNVLFYNTTSMTFTTFGKTAGTVTLQGPTIIVGNLGCTVFTVSGTSYTLSTITLTPTSVVITGNATFTYSGGSLAAVAAFTQTSGTVSLNLAYALTATGVYTLNAGALTLGGNLSTGSFVSTNTNTRSIAFGANNIILTTTTAGTVVVSMAIANNFTYTSSGTFGSGTGTFRATMSVTRTFQFGTTSGGSTTNAPRLYLDSGVSIATITSAGWWSEINYGTTAYAQAATSLNLNSLYTLNSTTTMATLTANMVGTGSIQLGANSIGPLAINSTTGTTTLLSTVTTTTCTLTTGTLNINSRILNCTIFTVATSNFVLSNGTLTPSTSIVINNAAGSFTYTGGTLAAVLTFTHTAGNVTFNKSYTMTVTGTYTFTAGVLTLAPSILLTTGIFSSNNSNTRSIGFGAAISQTSVGSVLMNGTTQYLTTVAADNGPLDLSTATSWTVECWIYATSLAGSGSIFWKGGGPSLNASYSLWLNTTTPQWIVGDGGAGGVSQNLPAITTFTWYHFALVRNGGFITAYINGVGSSPVAITTMGPTVNSTLWVGAAVDGRFFPGYITNLRVTKGIAVYTGNFTVPTGPLTITQSSGTNISAITGTETSLLLNFRFGTNNFLLDSSSYSNVMTNVAASISALRQPFGGSIVLTHTTAATTVVVMATITGFTWSGTGGFITAADRTKTIQTGSSAGGSITTAPNVSLTSGGSIVTITSGTWINNLDYGVTSYVQASSTINIAGSLLLSSGGTYTALTVGALGTGTFITNAKTITAFTVNTEGTITIVGALTMSAAFSLPHGTVIATANIQCLTFAGTGPYPKSIIGSNNTITVTGSYWDSGTVGSASFNGTTQRLTNTTGNAIIGMGAGDFTIECWIYPNAVATNPQVFAAAATTALWTFYLNNASLAIDINGVNVSTSGTISASTWTHVAWTRIGSGSLNNKVFINGILSNSFTNTTNFNNTQISVGANATGASGFAGLISNYRMVKTVGVYTGNFTVPTSPLTITQDSGTNITGFTNALLTSFLLSTPNDGFNTADFSAYNFAITIAGAVPSSANAPFLLSSVPVTFSDFVISMTSASVKTFYGGGLSYPTLNQGGAGAITVVQSNSFFNITNTTRAIITFASGTTQTFQNFSLAGIPGSLQTINASTAGSAAILSKASGIVYGSYLSIQDSNATGGATWYASPTSTNVSNNTGWIFTQLPIITIGNVAISGGITITSDAV